MAPGLDFYFDFSSPYGYIGSHKIEALAAKHGRTVNWRATLLGAAFKVTGGRPLPEMPLKGDYAKRDFQRSAKFHGVPFRMPSQFPVPTVAAVRAFWWLHDEQPQRAVALAKALYKAYFAEDLDIANAENVVNIATATGCSAGEVRAALADQAVKDRAKAEVEAAIAKGVFGSPYVIVDGEPFWGVDRFDQLDKWLATGGW
jgi:2-hydroxychromene-2-carboxylate isomerase